MIAVKDIEGRAKELDKLGVDYICVHTGYDLQAVGKILSKTLQPFTIFFVSTVTYCSIILCRFPYLLASLRKNILIIT